MKKTTAPTTSKEFDRFRELTKKLIQVPKSEVDKRMSEYEEKKKAPKNRNKQKVC